MGRLLAFLVLLLTTIASAHGGAGPRKIALVIGNSAYRNTVELPNPRNDATAMAAKLKRLGFDTELVNDGGKQAMEDAIRRFGSRSEGAYVALFFYAGHGMQANGVNYLVPVDAKLSSERDLKYQMIKLSDILDEMDEAQVKLVFLDACRDNPLSRSLAARNRSAGIGRGLAPVDAATGTLISYATKDGKTAEDGEGDHSPYTAALLAHAEDPVDLAIMLRRVRERVVKATQSRQEPWEYGSLVGGELYLAGAGPAPAAAPPPVAGGVDPVTVELEFWNSIKTSGDPEDFAAYLRQYPEGKFALLAQNRLRGANRTAAVAPAPAAATPVPVTAPARATSPADGKSFRDCPDCPEMVILPAGSFTMGTPAGEDGRVADEGPLHPVAIRAPFALGRYEVTRREFARFVSDTGYPGGAGCYVWRNDQWQLEADKNWRNPGFEQGDDHPVTCVNREDVREYLRWLNLKTGKSYRLPSEAEWEYAARAGTTAVRHWGDTPQDACAYANVADLSLDDMFARWALHDCNDGHAYTAPVGSFRPNAFGLHDVLGNVWEWTADCWHESYAGAPIDGSVREGGDCSRYARRGGSWNSMAKDVRSGNRSRRDGTLRNNAIGFRVAATLAPR